VRDLLKMLLPVMMFGVIALLFNYFRFGSPLRTAYGDLTGLTPTIPFYVGLFAFLFGSGKSIFIYNPPTVLALFSVRKFFNRYREEAVLCLAMIAVFLAFFSPIWFGSGDDAWGPRYMTPIIPFALLPVGVLLQEGFRSSLRRLAFIITIISGVYVQIMGISFPYGYSIEFLSSMGLYNLTRQLSFLVSPPWP